MLCLAQLGGGVGCSASSPGLCGGEMGHMVYTAPGGSPPMARSLSLCHPRPGGDINIGHMSQPRREFRQAPGKTVVRLQPETDGRGLSGRCQARSRLPGRRRPLSTPAGPRAHRGRAPPGLAASPCDRSPTTRAPHRPPPPPAGQKTARACA